MILSDIHMHSSFSTDSDASMESMILSAIEKGLQSICFTEHLDYEYPGSVEKDYFVVDIDAYEKKLYELKEIYKHKIEVLFGIEFGLMPHLADQYTKISEHYDFDFIIGSSHLIPAPWYKDSNDHGDPYETAFWQDRTADEICQKYFETIKNNVQAFHNFDTYAHLDYVIRYAPEKNKNFSYSHYKEVLDMALKTLIEHGIALEINTAGYKYGLGMPHPHIDILKRYKEFGGEMITIGADGHAPEHIGYDFKKAEILLKDLGYKYYTIFKKRNPVMLPL